MSALSRAPRSPRPEVDETVKTAILRQYVSDPSATPTSLSREHGVSRRTIHRWVALISQHPSSSKAPLRVQAPAIESTKPAEPEPSPKGTSPCPSCGTPLPVSWSDHEVLQHLSGCLPIQPASGTPELPQIAPGDHRGASRLRWYECQECGGQFEYLRQGGTCRGCEATISG